MFSILLDELPEEFEGYKINSDFRVGIQMILASEDELLNAYDKFEIMGTLLFGYDLQDADTVSRAIDWFLNGWNHDNPIKGSHVKGMDFEIDSGRIYSAFMSQYRIDLNIEDMHFWKFMNLLSNLEECSFTRVMDIRTKKIDGKMSKEERKLYMDGKRAYSLNKEETDEEEREAEAQATAEFLKALRG